MRRKAVHASRLLLDLGPLSGTCNGKPDLACLPLVPRKLEPMLQGLMSLIQPGHR